jgi:hypothetical protein
MRDPSADRAPRGLAAATLATLALVLVSGTFAAVLVNVGRAHEEAESARRAETVLAEVAAGERNVVDGNVAELGAALEPTESAIRRALV